MTIKRSPSPVF